MTITQLARICPAITASLPSRRVSKRYNFVPTRPIIDRLMSQGWQITGGHQTKSDIYGHHRIDMHPANLPTTNGLQPRVFIFNSHNARSRLSFGVGFFRLVCSNGLIISAGHSAQDAFVHRGQNNIEKQLTAALDSFKLLPQQVETMLQTPLRQRERIDFGRRALALKRNLGGPAFVNATDAEDILTPRRSADNTADLWTTFNVVQENLISPRNSRRVNNVYNNRRINVGLWDLATQYTNN